MGCGDINCFEVDQIEDVLSINYIYGSIDKKEIQEITSLLDPEHLMVFFLSEDLFITDEFLTDPIYKTRYKATKIDAELVSTFKTGDLSWSKVRSGVHLPEKNPFIPNNFSLKELPATLSDYPNAIYQSDSSTVWHWQDNKFRLPKSIITLVVYLNPTLFAGSLRNNQLMMIWRELFNDHTRSLSYMAQTARIDSHLFQNNLGLQFLIDSFDESLQSYFPKLIEMLGEFSKDPKELFTHNHVVM